MLKTTQQGLLEYADRLEARLREAQDEFEAAIASGKDSGVAYAGAFGYARGYLDQVIGDLRYAAERQDVLCVAKDIHKASSTITAAKWASFEHVVKGQREGRGGFEEAYNALSAAVISHRVTLNHIVSGIYLTHDIGELDAFYAAIDGENYGGTDEGK